MGIWQQAILALNDLFTRQKPKEKGQTRAYAGAAINRLTSDWISSSTSADSEIRSSLRVLRNRSRELCRNNDYAKGALRTITNNVVGKGIPLQSQVKKKRGDKLDETINTAIEDLWVQWQAAKYCHVSGKLCFPDIERLLMRSIVESGEVLVRLVRQPFAGSPVPLALEIIEADQLCDEYTSNILSTSNQVRMGVEVDAWQRPVAYWLYPHHPGDYQFHFKTNELLRIPASQVLHLYLCDRPGQTRGVPWFHTALMRLRHVGGFEEAELVAARAQAAVMGFIQSPDGGDLLGETYNERRVSSLEPGAIEVLGPGETFAGFAPTRPSQGFDPFVRMMLRAVASGVGMSYEALSSDYSNTSYSSARTALLDERDNYRIVQDWLITNFHQPVFELWLELAVMVGALNLPNYELNPRVYQKTRWVPRGWQWVDPQNEVAAYKEAIKAGFTTTSQVVAQSGLDIEDVLKERRRELDLAQESKIAFDTTLETKEEDKKESLLSQFEGRAFIPGFQKRAKNCKKGKSCGNSCIAKNKQCRKTLPATAAAAAPTVAFSAPKKKVVKDKKAASSPPALAGQESVGVDKVGGVNLPPAEVRSQIVQKVYSKYEEKGVSAPDVDKAISSLEKVFNDNRTRISMATNDQYFEDFLNNGAYNDFSGKGEMYSNIRKQIEHRTFGISTDATIANRPYYAYLTSEEALYTPNSVERDIKGYGNIRLVFKNQIKENATVSRNDSFDGSAATPLTKPTPEFLWNHYSQKTNIAPDAMSELTKLNQIENLSSSYTEVQLHKRPTTADLDKIYVGTQISKKREKEIKKMLASRGLSHVKVVRGEFDGDDVFLSDL